MSRKKYVLKPEEVGTLLRGLIENGQDETYKRMKEKALSSMEKAKDLDEMFLDMSEDFLDKARVEVGDTEESKQIKDSYYLLHSMLRILAHEVGKKYLKNGKERKSERLLKVISYNKDCPPSFQLKKEK